MSKGELQFVKMPACIAMHPDLTPIDKLYYWRIKRFCGPDNKGIFFESVRTTSKVLGVSKDSISKGLKKLLDMGMLIRVPSPAKSNAYRLVDPSRVFTGDYISAVAAKNYDPAKWSGNTLRGPDLASTISS